MLKNSTVKKKYVKKDNKKILKMMKKTDLFYPPGCPDPAHTVLCMGSATEAAYTFKFDRKVWLELVNQLKSVEASRYIIFFF